MRANGEIARRQREVTVQQIIDQKKRILNGGSRVLLVVSSVLVRERTGLVFCRGRISW